MESAQDKVKGEVAKQWVKRTIKESGETRVKEHLNIISHVPTIYHFTRNQEKNRYQNIVLYDANRVILETPVKGDTDYIHANFVLCKTAYILTQAPLKNTALEFWRMVWQENTTVIVCLIPVKTEEECVQYWPAKPGKTVKFGSSSRFEITNKNEKSQTEKEADYRISELLVTCREGKEKQERRIAHMHYLTWPEERQPPDTIVGFVEELWAQQKAMETMRNIKSAPIVVHCNSGARRSGTFTAISACCRDLLVTGKVDVKANVNQIKRERYGCLQDVSQYFFIYRCLTNFALKKNRISKSDSFSKPFIDAMKKAEVEEKDHSR